MTVTGPRIKDFTADTGSRFPVDVVADPVFEALLGLFVVAARDNESLTDFEAGPEWFEAVHAEAGPDLVAGLERLAGLDEVWLGLLGPALDLGDGRTIAGLAEHVRTGDPTEFRRQLVALGCRHCRDDAERDLVARAVAGDTEALERIVAGDGCTMPERLQELLAAPPAESAEIVATTLLAWERDVAGDGDAIGLVLRRDAEHKRALATTMDAPQLVETATNGITFRMVPEIDRIVLIPSVVIRPWVTIADHGRTRIFCYPVAEQHLDADADTPPAWLVDVYKALGDERRLRLLRILKDGPASLADITARTDLAKSTVHHHLRVLRSAGLVRATVGADTEYSLRSDAIPDAARLLAGFLETD